MKFVRPKKNLGQHFLLDYDIADKIVESIFPLISGNVLEIGPGTGILTERLISRDLNLKIVEIDKESIEWLKGKFPALKDNIIEADFLKLNLIDIFKKDFIIIGNFPYNISSQILFKTLDFKEQVISLAGMFQKEVAVRITSGPGNKDYGILSVLIQAYYNTEYLFTVSPEAFNPPPKVNSGVIRLTRHDKDVPCSYLDLKRTVKTAFNQRRKTLRNALKPLLFGKIPDNRFLDKRAEQLSVEDFIELTELIRRSSIT